MSVKRFLGLGVALMLTVGAAGVMTQRDFSPTSALAAEEGHDALQEQMEALDRGMKKLRRSLRKDDAWQESLEVVVEMQHASLGAKGEVPQMMEKVAEGDRPKMIAGYQKEMAELTRELLSLEIALLDQDAEAASAIYENLKEIKKVGHENFQVSE